MVLRRGGLLIVALALAAMAHAQGPFSGQPATTGPVSLSTTTCPGSGCTTLTVAGYGSVGIQITGTWVGTISFSGSVDRANFAALNCTAPNSTSPVTTTTATGTWTCDVAGLAQVQAAFTAYTSGTATVTLQAGPSSTARGQAPTGSGGTSSSFGAAFPASGTAAGFKDSGGVNMQPGNLDASGNVKVNCATGCAGASDVVGATTALNALNGAATVALTGEGGAGFQLAAGTLIGTIVPELSMDGGTTWVATVFYDPTANSTASSIVFGSSNGAITRTILTAAGTSTARVRVSAFTSGTANATLRATQTAAANYVTLTGGSTVTANAGTGPASPWKVDLSGTGANTTAVKVDGSAVTQPVSGTVTANIGTTNGLALDASVTGLQVTQGSTTAGQKGGLAQGAVTTAAPAYTTAQTSPLSLTTAGALRVDGSAVTQPVSGTVTANAGTGPFTIQANASVNVAQVNGSTTATAATGVQKVGVTGNAGAALDAAGQNAASPANELLIAGQFNTTPTTITSGNVSPLQLTSAGRLITDGSQVTQPVSGTVTANEGGAPWSQNLTQVGGTAVATGTGASGLGIPRVTVSNDSNVLATQSGTWTVQPGNTANTTAWLVKLAAATPVLENGLSTTVQTVVGSAATLDAYYCYNPNAAVAYVQIFDAATVTLGTTTPKWSIGIPATSGANLSNVDLTFATAIKVAATTTATGSAANASGVDCNFSWR